MEWTGLKNKAVDFFKKYKYAWIILLIGLVLMLLPDMDGNEQSTQEQPAQTVEDSVNLSQELAGILSKIDGVGKVEVMLTVANGEETFYQQDTDISNSDNGSQRFDTVIITDADRNESGLVKQVNPPVYLGAIIVCQGADRAAVKLAIVEAVSRVTGLGADCISVLKMK